MSKVIPSTDLSVKQVSFESVLKGTGLVDDQIFLHELKPVYNFERAERSYPPDVFQQFLELVRLKCYPDLALEDALFELGRKSFQGYYKGTIVGRVALAAIHLMGPKRLMYLGPRLLEDAGLGQVQAEKITECKHCGHYRNFLLMPLLMAGISIESFEVAKAINLRYEVKTLPSPGLHLNDFDITFEWD